MAAACQIANATFPLSNWVKLILRLSNFELQISVQNVEKNNGDEKDHQWSKGFSISSLKSLESPKICNKNSICTLEHVPLSLPSAGQLKVLLIEGVGHTAWVPKAWRTKTRGRKGPPIRSYRCHKIRAGYQIRLVSRAPVASKIFQPACLSSFVSNPGRSIVAGENVLLGAGSTISGIWQPKPNQQQMKTRRYSFNFLHKFWKHKQKGTELTEMY